MLPVTAIFDIGRTNKKFFLFDENFREVHREYTSFDMIGDEDGFPTENLPALQAWLREVFDRILTSDRYAVQAINFSAYGASFVHLDEQGEPVTPLYNYEKPLPDGLEADFLSKYGPAEEIARATGSDAAGMLNSGMQLYWLKHYRPEVFARIRYSLHLPQYLSYVFTGIPLSEYTSIGCHTRLWDYDAGDYHAWVYAEGLHRILPPIVSTETSINLNYNGKHLRIGVGIHDSSAALLPYIRSEHKPFALVSTGTWSVALNPFSSGSLTEDDLFGDCINYMRIDGKPVKATRLFLGEEYKYQVEWLADQFGVPKNSHREVRFDLATCRQLIGAYWPCFSWKHLGGMSNSKTILKKEWDYETAYHQLMLELVSCQCDYLNRAIGETKLNKVYIDGGFSDNEIYVKLMAFRYKGLKLRTTKTSLGSALGAAIAVGDTTLDSKFLKKNYGLKKHQPFILALD